MGLTFDSKQPAAGNSASSPIVAAALTFGAAIGVFFVAFVLHEVLHVAVITALGKQAVVVIRPWRFSLLDLAPLSVHIQPVPALDVGRQLVVNFLGPALAAAVVAVWFLNTRSRPLRFALVANIAVLLFYSAIESFAVLAQGSRQEIALLLTPDFNYGLPFAMFAFAALLASRLGTPPRTRVNSMRS